VDMSIRRLGMFNLPRQKGLLFEKRSKNFFQLGGGAVGWLTDALRIDGIFNTKEEKRKSHEGHEEGKSYFSKWFFGLG